MLIPIFVAIVLYASVYLILAVSAAITLLALYEFNGLAIVQKRDAIFDWTGVMAGTALVPVVYYGGAGSFAPAALVLLFAFFFYAIVSGRELKDASQDTTHKAFGLVYIALPLSFLTPLREIENGQWWLLFLLIVIWSNDTFAYFIGRGLGAPKLASEISPKKTVEGAAGGIIGGAAVAVLFSYLAGMGLSPLNVFVLAAVIGIVAMIGDLAESVLKRAAGVKDSGAIIPGHGGVLDRIDSLLFSVPLLYYYLACQV